MSRFHLLLRQRAQVGLLVLIVLLAAAPAAAAGLAGRVADRTGAVLPDATVRLHNVTTGLERETSTDSAGDYRFDDLAAGVYRLVASRTGFSEASRTVVLREGGATVTVDFVLDLGALRADVTVAAARGERDASVVPLRVDAISSAQIAELAAASTGDVMLEAPGVTAVGSGPFQIRPRLRGLDSTRVLVLIDGERLNNARTATDRAGVEVGLVSVDEIETVEVLGGAGSVLYGTDALAGTINIVTESARLVTAPRFQFGADGLYSSNENGRRGTVSAGYASARWSLRFTGGVESFDDYSAGRDFAESSQALIDAGVIEHLDTVDQLGFAFGAFPDPFNAPFTRTSAEIPGSSMEASSISLSARAMLSPSQELSVRYQRRHASDIGFPDFAAPTFFQNITLPFSRLDKVAATWAATGLAGWFPRLAVTGYYQHQDRQLRNRVPVQFPAPSPQFFPVSVFRLDIDSTTRQRVWTPGVDVQATFLPRADNVLTIGATVFRDRSEDERSSRTATSLIGQVTLGMRGPQATVFPAPILLDAGETTHPTRVPDASFRDVGLFVHDEWELSRAVRLTGGLRLDRYSVTTDATPGYDVASLVSGAMPAIDPATLPDIAGDRLSRTALTGEAGVVLWSAEPVSLFAHYVRSYRHANLEELLFSGPATAGNIAPNVTVEPETGHNVDVGARVRGGGFGGSAAYFVNHYDGFISTEIVASSPAGSISQAINLAEVRIQGVEAEADATIVRGALQVMPWMNVALTRGTVLSGENPLTGAPLDGAPQDNITPWKLVAGLDVRHAESGWRAGWSLRAQGDVTRVSPLLADSPFLIAQDLFSLGGFTLHRLSAGYDWRVGGQRVGLSLVVDNLTDAFYREHFQFAPARGRSVSIAIDVTGAR